MTKEVRDGIKTTIWEKQNARESFRETFKPLISQFEKPREGDKRENLFTQNQKLIQNQLAITEGLREDQKPITDGLEKINETNERLADIGELPGFEAIDAPEPVTQESIVTSKPTTQTSKEIPIAKFKAEDLDRYLMKKEAQDILKVNDYYKLPSDYFTEDVLPLIKQLMTLTKI